MGASLNAAQSIPADLARLRQLFEEALEQPPDQRKAWLERVCPEEPCLREQVERMLAADSSDHPLLDFDQSRSPDGERERATRGQSLQSCGVTGPSFRRDVRAPLFEGGELFASRFQIMGLRGRGGMGQVYAAEDLEVGQRVALKFLAGSPSSDRCTRLRTEVRLARQIAHPNVCRVYDIGEADGHLYLSMEYVDGEDLSTRLAREGRLPAPQALDVARKLCAGLGAAHGKGILHRDLKPGNIMIDGEGEPRIMDFGLASLAETQCGELPGRAGTPAYMSPEQLAGSDATIRGDIYALGLVLYELFTGAVAFPGATAAEFARLRQRTPAARPSVLVGGLDAAIEDTILRCLDPLPGNRPATAREVADLLGGGTAVQNSTATPARRGGQGRRYLMLAAASLVIAAAVASLWWARATMTASYLATLAQVQVQPLTLDGNVALGSISPDGQHLVYQPYEQLALHVRQLSAGTDRQLVPGDRFTRISSLTVGPRNDFVDIVATSGDSAVPNLWRIPLSGGRETRLLRDVVSAVGWSPDGRHMAYLHAGGAAGAVSLVVADADGSHPRELATRTPPRMFYSDLTAAIGRPPGGPAWSPNGKWLTVAAYTEAALGNTSDLVTIDATTGLERDSVSMPGTWSEVAWLDEHRYLLVGGEHPHGFPTKQVWVSDRAGTRTAVTREFGFFMNLSLTADRTTALAKRFSRVSGIWVSDAAGRSEQIAVPLSVAAAAHPKIDNAGGLTYLALKPDGAGALYYLPAGGKVPVPLVDTLPPPFVVPFHDVSADGRTIIYRQLAEPQALFVTDNSATQRRQLVESDVAIARITPDGSAVLFTRNNAPGLFAIPTDGGAIRQLSDRAIPDGRIDRRFGPGFSISPTGRQLLVQTGTVGRLALCDLPRCDRWTDLALPSLRWSRDGTAVAFVRDSTTIVEQPLSGAPARVTARLDGRERIIDLSWSPDGSRLVTSRGWYPNDMVIIKGLR